MRRGVRSRLQKSLVISIISAFTFSMTELLIDPPEARADLLCFFRIRRCRDQIGRPSNRQGGGLRTGRARGGTQSNIPYVISPRNTWLEDDQFTIRWHPVSGATRYAVRLWRWSDERDELDWLVWQATVDGAQVDYQGQIPLQRGRYYSIEVVSDTGVASCLDEGFDQSGFELIFPEDIAVLEADLDRLDQQEATSEEAALDLAMLYLREDLISAAVDVLEPFAANGTNNPVVYEALGDLYSYAGLNGLSAQHYQKALDISTAREDTFGRAIALNGLAEVNATLGKLDDAIQLFTQAKFLYSTSDISLQQVDSIQRRINTLEQAKKSDVAQPDASNFCEMSESSL